MYSSSFRPSYSASNYLSLDLLGRVIVCCILLILSSGCVYMINDLADIEADRAHPVKRLRPIAAGKLSASTAKAAAVALPPAGAPGGLLF